MILKYNLLGVCVEFNNNIYYFYLYRPFYSDFSQQCVNCQQNWTFLNNYCFQIFPDQLDSYQENFNFCFDQSSTLIYFYNDDDFLKFLNITLPSPGIYVRSFLL